MKEETEGLKRKYIGYGSVKVDRKNRLIIPKNFIKVLKKRNISGNEVYISATKIPSDEDVLRNKKEQIPALVIYGIDDANKRIERVFADERPFNELERICFSSGKIVEIDQIGRINIGKDLAEHIGIKDEVYPKKVLYIGGGKCVFVVNYNDRKKLFF